MIDGRSFDLMFSINIGYCELAKGETQPFHSYSCQVFISSSRSLNFSCYFLGTECIVIEFIHIFISPYFLLVKVEGWKLYYMAPFGWSILLLPILCMSVFMVVLCHTQGSLIFYFHLLLVLPLGSLWVL